MKSIRLYIILFLVISGLSWFGGFFDFGAVAFFAFGIWLGYKLGEVLILQR